MRRWIVSVALLGGAMSTAGVAQSPDTEPRVLVFSRTQGFRHDSIPAGVQALQELGREHGFAVEATEDAAAFERNKLHSFVAVVFLNTTGDVLDVPQQEAFEAYIRAGGGFVGVHAAADTEPEWDWYGRLVGARFKAHPEVQPAVVAVLDDGHPSTSHLPRKWRRVDEWYDFKDWSRAEQDPPIRLLASVDESTYKGGTMGPEHPFAWCREVDGGRSWYTAGGHTSESYGDPRFRKHLLGGVAWAGRIDIIDLPAPQPSRPPRQSVRLDMRRYAGPHQWEGVIHVTNDDVLYHDMDVEVAASGIPAGVTFSGDRSGITLRGVSIHGPADGVVVQNNQTVNDVVIDHCRFIDCRTPQDGAQDPLLGSRGYGLFVSGGRNWAIHRSEFTTKAPDAGDPSMKDFSVQYAVRMGQVQGLNVTASRFANHAGKACAWLMFVRAASFKHCRFEGGSVRLGVRSDDMEGVDVGDCRNIIFSKCRFDFGVFADWPASVVLWPGCEGVRFEDCVFNTHPESGWWLEVDGNAVTDVSWSGCTWNGKPIEGFIGVRTDMSADELASKRIGPSAAPSAARP